MDLLSFIKEKHNSNNQVVHPFAYRDVNFKYLYCFGLGVVACGSMKAMTEIRQYLDQIVDSMLLTANYKDKIIIDINNNFDYKINDVFELLITKEERYCFAADLYRISNKSLWAQDYCENIIDIYMQIFHFVKEERNFFQEFMLLSEKNNKEKAMELYRDFTGEGFRISYRLLQYMFPDFLLEETYESIVLEHGSRLILDKPTKILGNVTIQSGASLVIDGATVKLTGTIFVSDGKLTIKNADIFVKDCKEEYAFVVANTALVIIEDTIIDCNFKSGMMKQSSGHLVINNTTIQNTKFSRGITFTGRSLIMNGVTMQDCLAGGIHNLENSEMDIDDCNFYNCNAEHGGAIYSDSLESVSISNSKFQNCNAKYLGGAVYFTYMKYGQTVSNCELLNCIPKDSNLFNVYNLV